MSKLGQLRRQLASLRRARQSARWGTGLCAAGIAILAALGVLFLLDVYFELNVPQRLLMFAVAIAAVVWAIRKYAVPYFTAGESIEAMALQVERQHSIPSDLIAALQFESPAASTWGSTMLEQQVITRVVQTSPKLNVFAGFSRETLLRRGAILAAMAAIAIIAGVMLPEYFRVFGQRLLLANVHYPTATTIESIQVGHALAYERTTGTVQPHAVSLPQGQSVDFVIATRGVAPAAGYVTLQDSSGRERELAVEQLTLEARRQRLEAAQEMIASPDHSDAAQFRAATLLQADAPSLATSLRAGQHARVRQQLQQQLAAWPKDRFAGELYVGELPRLIASVDYQVYLGDAWTDRAAINMIGLPVVEVEYHITPPSYAVASDDAAHVEIGARRISVLEGSKVELIARCVNGKELTNVTLTITDPAATEETPPQRIAFNVQNDEGTLWKYAPQQGPLSSVKRQLQLSISCRDADGLSLEAPLTCSVHLEADRAPTAAASVVHKVVLPGASPRVEYRVADDYAIASIKLLVDVERAKTRAETASDRDREPADSSDDGTEQVGLSRAGERHELSIAPEVKRTVITGPWPHTGSYNLDLSAYSLVKGDHVKLTLQVTDFRGESPGETTLSDPLIVEVSDESGVLAAISEADQRSEERLNELIKRQLGIGETP